MISEGEAVQALSKFFKDRWYDQVEDFALQYPDSTAFDVDYWALRNYNRELEDLIENEPHKLFKCVPLALNLIEYPIDIKFTNATIRISGFPIKTAIRDIRNKHIHKFIKVEGLIRRASDVKPKDAIVAFECMRCGHVTYIPQHSNKVVEPFECEAQTCGKKGPFKRDFQLSTFDDFQILEVQESPDTLRGTQPRSLTVHLYNELTDAVTTGDKVIISGILVTSQQTSREGKSTIADVVLEANHIEKMDKSYDELEITEKDKADIIKLSENPKIKSMFMQSIAPSICGLDEIKEALSLQLMSGVVKNLPDGTRIRGDIHVLLVGDPGTAKSQLVKRIVELSPRGVFNSGKSASSVGLTAAVVKDVLNDDRWTLEGGSLVMADNGLCVVDEMDKMRQEDVSALHEALEQQMITISKAGIHASLMTRCAMVAAANPIHGRFDQYEGLSKQINMTPTLLSRFDLIFIIRDQPSRENDAKIASHISANHMFEDGVKSEHLEPPIPADLLRKYVAYARANVKPKITKEAKQLIENYYVDVRNMQKSDTIPITARSIDGLYRLAEASAKIRLSEVVTFRDAQDAINLVSSCLRNVCLDPNTGQFDIESIECGISHSQRSKMNLINKFIREHEEFTFDEFVDSMGLDANTCNEYINIAKREGKILKVEANVYKSC